MQQVLEEGQELLGAQVLGQQPLAFLEDESQLVLLGVDEDLEQLAEFQHLIAKQALFSCLEEVDVSLGDEYLPLRVADNRLPKLPHASALLLVIYLCDKRMDVGVDHRSLEVNRLRHFCELPDDAERLHLLSDGDHLAHPRYFFRIERDLLDVLRLRLLEVDVRGQIGIEDLGADLRFLVGDFEHLDILAHPV